MPRSFSSFTQCFSPRGWELFSHLWTSACGCPMSLPSADWEPALEMASRSAGAEGFFSVIPNFITKVINVNNQRSLTAYNRGYRINICQ